MRSCVKCQLVLLTVATLAACVSETLADVPEEARKGKWTTEMSGKTNADGTFYLLRQSH
jgi:hypothetical protein